MRKSKFTESQIMAILAEGEAGLPVGEICRKRGISDATYYNWKSKFGGMSVSEAQRLRALELENSKLKRLLADAHLDIAALKDVVGRKW